MSLQVSRSSVGIGLGTLKSGEPDLALSGSSGTLNLSFQNVHMNCDEGVNGALGEDRHGCELPRKVLAFGRASR
jgi:hypothetical protein